MLHGGQLLQMSCFNAASGMRSVATIINVDTNELLGEVSMPQAA